jgi:hypothetical protein
MYDTKIQAFLKGLGHVPEARPAALDLYYTKVNGGVKAKGPSVYSAPGTAYAIIRA